MNVIAITDTGEDYTENVAHNPANGALYARSILVRALPLMWVYFSA
jgi:hypothetical protein